MLLVWTMKMQWRPTWMIIEHVAGGGDPVAYQQA